MIKVNLHINYGNDILKLDRYFESKEKFIELIISERTFIYTGRIKGKDEFINKNSIYVIEIEEDKWKRIKREKCFVTFLILWNKAERVVVMVVLDQENVQNGIRRKKQEYEKQKIIIDYKLDNWNDTINHCRNNKYHANTRKKKEMDIIKYHLLGIKKITKYPIKLNCIWHIVNMNSDLDNKSLKSVLDQMQLSGILENDNCKHITEINHKVVKDNRDYLELEIEV